MTEKKYFIIEVEKLYHDNAFWQYDEKSDEYDFVCYVDDSDIVLMKLNELAKENMELKQKIKEMRE